MRIFHVVLLIGLSLIVGASFGYIKWGVQALRVSEDIDALRIEAEVMRRERDACHAGAEVGQLHWEGFGVVRAVFPKILVITHEEIPGNLPAQTTSFRLDSTTLHYDVSVGDAIYFTLQGLAFDTAVIVKMKNW